MSKTIFYVVVLCLVGGYVFQPMLHPLVEKHLGFTVDEEKLIELVGKSKAQYEEAKVAVVEKAKEVEVTEKVNAVTEKFKSAVAETQGSEESEDGAPELYGGEVKSQGFSESNNKNLTPVVEVMKASLKKSPTSRFGFDDVVEWYEVGDIIVQGKEYREGQILVRMNTIIGSNEHRVQAIIDGDSVVRWILISTRESVL